MNTSVSLSTFFFMADSVVGECDDSTVVKLVSPGGGPSSEDIEAAFGGAVS